MEIPYETVYVETRFGPTHTIISGNVTGKPIVLWHGLNANSAFMANWITALAPRHRVYAIDTIGGMGKSAPCRPAKKGPAFGRWAAETLAGLGLAKANLVGVSNGGWLIIKLGSVAAGMIGSAILMSAGGFTPISKLLILRMVPYLALKSPAVAACRFLRLLLPPTLPPDPATLEMFELILGHFR